jgi:hypothetical protein
LPPVCLCRGAVLTPGRLSVTLRGKLWGYARPPVDEDQRIRVNGYSVVATFYTLDRANDRIPELGEMLRLLRNQRDELRELKATFDATEPGDDQRRLRLRMQGLVDQMQATVARIDGWGITLRDIDTGLIDFPALVSGRQVWLCWRLGEDDIGWWHEMDDGFAGRRPLIELA